MQDPSLTLSAVVTATTTSSVSTVAVLDNNLCSKRIKYCFDNG